MLLLLLDSSFLCLFFIEFIFHLFVTLVSCSLKLELLELGLLFLKIGSLLAVCSLLSSYLLVVEAFLLLKEHHFFEDLFLTVLLEFLKLFKTLRGLRHVPFLLSIMVHLAEGLGDAAGASAHIVVLIADAHLDVVFKSARRTLVVMLAQVTV